MLAGLSLKLSELYERERGNSLAIGKIHIALEALDGRISRLEGRVEDALKLVEGPREEAGPDQLKAKLAGLEERLEKVEGMAQKGSPALIALASRVSAMERELERLRREEAARAVEAAPAGQAPQAEGQASEG